MKASRGLNPPSFAMLIAMRFGKCPSICQIKARQNHHKSAGMAEQKKGFFHVIREKYCKGCGICVAFCPKQLLVLKNGKVFPERPEICIGCHMCEYRCPDFAIEVKPIEEKTEAGNNVDNVDLSLPPEAHHG